MQSAGGKGWVYMIYVVCGLGDHVDAYSWQRTLLLILCRRMALLKSRSLAISVAHLFDGARHIRPYVKLLAVRNGPQERSAHGERHEQGKRSYFRVVCITPHGTSVRWWMMISHYLYSRNKTLWGQKYDDTWWCEYRNLVCDLRVDISVHGRSGCTRKRQEDFRVERKITAIDALIDTKEVFRNGSILLA